MQRNWQKDMKQNSKHLYWQKMSLFMFARRSTCMESTRISSSPCKKSKKKKICCTKGLRENICVWLVHLVRWFACNGRVKIVLVITCNAIKNMMWSFQMQICKKCLYFQRGIKSIPSISLLACESLVSAKGNFDRKKHRKCRFCRK